MPFSFKRINHRKYCSSYSRLFFLTALHIDNVYSRFSCQLELQHRQALSSQMINSTNLLPNWVNGSSSSVQDVFMRLDQYKRQLLSGVLCINMDLQGSFNTEQRDNAESILAAEALAMHRNSLTIPCAADSVQAISST